MIDVYDLIPEMAKKLGQKRRGLLGTKSSKKLAAPIKNLKEIGKIKNITESKTGRADDLLKLKRSFKSYLDLYFLLKRIKSSDFIRREEYRKNVTLISQLGPDENLEVTVPILTEYFKKTKEFVDLLEEFIG